MFRLGFIDYYLDEWHANNYPQWIWEASAGRMQVTHAYALIDSPKGGRTTAAWCEAFGVAQCGTIEEVVEQCDGLIVLAPDDCQMHELLCEKPLRSGKPVYVDKTFAPDAQTARRIFAIAQEHATPCYSTSALRFAQEYAGIEKERIKSLCSWGPGRFDVYVIHQLEPVMMLMDCPAKRVMSLPGEGWVSLLIEFADGRCATIACYEAGAPFEMNLCMTGGNAVITVNSDFFKAFIARMVDFFHTPQIQVPHEETLRIMAVRGAGVKAVQNPFTWIAV